jgi:hypothetical protein
VLALLVILAVAVVVLLAVTLRLARRVRAVGGGGDRAQPRAPAVRAPTANVAVVTLYEIWMGRAERDKLGARDDNWADLSRAPQYESWRRLAEARGAGQDVQHYVTRSLLSEVIYAAGGVEREFLQLRKALADVQQLADEAVPPPPQSAQGQPISRPYVGARPVREASYCFVNLLSWARSTVERTDRPYKPGSSQRAGLLPALPPGQLHDSVAAALQHLRTALRDSRSLASYAFHTGAVPAEGAPRTEILPDGRNLTRLADPLADPALAGEAFEFSEDRDMLAYATELMAAIEVFVNRVLDAFAASRPASPETGGSAHNLDS